MQANEVLRLESGGVLSLYVPPKTVRGVVLICPGGGYQWVAPREGEPVARAFNAGGWAAAVLEYTCYQGNYYGTPEFSVFPWLEKGVNVILDIEVEGAANIKKKYPEALTIFLIPPSAAALRTRLEGRGTETEEQINGRLARAAEEAPIAKQYEALIVNDDLNVCVAELRRLIDDPSLAEAYYRKNLPLVEELERTICEI